MHRSFAQLAAGSLNKYTATALTASLLGLLTALPPAPASATVAPSQSVRSASALSPSALSSYQLSGLLTPAQLEELLSGLKVGGLGSGAISPESLSKAIASLPGVQALKIEKLQEALKSALEGLGSGTTLKEMLENPTAISSTVVTTLESLLGGLLGGQSATITKELEEALSKVSGGEILKKLLGSAESPAAVVETLLKLLPTSLVERVLGGLPSGLPVSRTTVEGLAGDMGTTPEKLVEDLGGTAEQLPSTSEALLAPLSNGKTLAVVNGADKLVASTLKSLTGSGEPGGSGSGGGSGTGGTGGGTGGLGGSGGSGAGGTGGAPAGGVGNASAAGPTVIVNLPRANAGVSSSRPPKKHGKGRDFVRILRHRVKGRRVMLLVKVGEAGRLIVRNKHVRMVERHVGRARKLSLLVMLTKRSARAARHGRHGLRLRLRVVFKPRHGARSHAVARLLFRR